MKSSDELTGIESYISKSLNANDNYWIPSSRCMLVERVDPVSRMDAAQGAVGMASVALNNGSGYSSLSKAVGTRLASLESGQEQLTGAVQEVNAKVHTVCQDVRKLL